MELEVLPSTLVFFYFFFFDQCTNIGRQITYFPWPPAYLPDFLN
ncbi:hypothetical protein [Lactococcus cremoris]|nr:hypothetical protein [Lactococcus cremoris]